MASYFNKDHKGSTPWYVKFRYTDKDGKKQTMLKRGFRTQAEAKKFEKKFLADVESDKEYLFERFIEFYLKDKSNRVKYSTMLTKEHIIRKFILPEFIGKDIRDITVKDLTEWQIKRLFEKDEEGNRKYTDTYIRTVNVQLRAIFNYAMKKKYIDENPIDDLENVGKKESDRKYITWSDEDIALFLNNITDYEDAYMAFMILFYTGIRCGELLALTLEDIDLENNIMYIKKTFHRYGGKDVITTPKTEKSKREILLPDFLCEEIKSYIDLQYKPEPDQRLFQAHSSSFLETAMKTGCKRTGLPIIRIHDTRHSHITNLGENNIPIKDIADRVGQRGESITFHYSHSTRKGKNKITDYLEKEGRKINVE